MVFHFQMLETVISESERSSMSTDSMGEYTYASVNKQSTGKSKQTQQPSGAKPTPKPRQGKTGHSSSSGSSSGTTSPTRKSPEVPKSPRTLKPAQQKSEPASQDAQTHFAKNPNLASRNIEHIKAKTNDTVKLAPVTTVTNGFDDYEDVIVETHGVNNETPKAAPKTKTTEKEHKVLSKKDSDRLYENFTLARKEGRPIYVARSAYR